MSIDGTIQLNVIVTEFLSKQSKPFEPIKGNQALVITEGTIKDVKLAQIRSTAGVCTTEEVDARKIGCGVTFNDMKTWGLDTALCIEETCVGKGMKIYGGPVYYPNSSVCLAAEQQGLFKPIESMKLVRFSEIDQNPIKYDGVLKNNIQSDSGDFKDAPKPWTIWFDDELEKCPKFVDNDAKEAKKKTVLSFIQSKQSNMSYPF